VDRGKLTYAQAEEAFAELERQRQAGEIDESAYRQELGALRVRDEQGRTWMLQERTGQWFVFDQGVWVASNPPGIKPSPPPIPPPPTPTPTPTPTPAPTGQPATQQPQTVTPPQAAPRPAPSVAPARGRSMSCLGVTLRILIWDLLWIGVALVVYAFIGQRMPWLFIPVGLLAATTMVLWLRRLGRRATRGA
jgi:hypothetical protein